MDENQRIHRLAQQAHAAYQVTWQGTRTWDELDTYEHVAWRDVVRAVLEAVAHDKG